MISKLKISGIGGCLLIILIACKQQELPTVITSDVINITVNSATSGGTVTSDVSGEITARGVCWSIGESPTVEDSKTSDGTGTGTFTSTINGLNERTSYIVRAYASSDAGTSYGEEKIFTTSSSTGQIIADHSIVDDFDKIPANYLAEVKKMMVSILGESHAAAYRKGVELLESLYPAFSSNVSTGEAYNDNYLRVDNGPETGEARWFTWYAYPAGSRPVTSSVIKTLIKEYSDHGHPMHIVGFGWCWDMVGLAVVGGESEPDPVYGCRFLGTSAGGPDGDLGWGLDAGDYSISSNRVSLDTYLQATEDYINYCKTNGYVTIPIFTTGTVDGGGGGYFRGEIGYQGFLKNERIREYVRSDSTRILLDYADILCYDNDGKVTTTTWNGHTYPICTSANEYPINVGHISDVGAVRLAKALWWLMARVAGWDGK